MAAAEEIGLARLMDQIEGTVNDDPAHPWCLHRLCYSLTAPAGTPDRDRALVRTERAADALARNGRVRRETVSAMTIGVHCQDSLYWSVDARKERLSDFGPEYESPAVLRRLASHFECHGL